MVGRRDRVPKKYADLPESVQDYFGGFRSIILIDEKYAWDILVGYLFMQVERAQYSIVYCAMVKKQGTNKDVTRGLLSLFRIKRKEFPILYKILGGTEISEETIRLAKNAEKIRDKIIHGNDKQVSKKMKKDAIVSILEYSDLLNEHSYADFGFRPFGDLTGFNGRRKTLGKKPSRWIIKGILAELNKKKPKTDEEEEENENNPQHPPPANPQAQVPPNAQ